MSDDQLIRNIRSLPRYIHEVYTQNDEEKFGLFKSHYSVFHRQIKVLYDQWYPKAKPVNDTILIDQLFVNNASNKYDKNKIKYSLACLLKTSERVYNNIASLNRNDQRFFNEIELLQEISFEAAMFLQMAIHKVEGKNLDFGHWKRGYIDPFETFAASSQILRKNTERNSSGGFVFAPSAIFMIRQAIELWLQAIFGIDYVIDANKNELVKLQPEKLFDLLDNANKLVNIPVPKSTIIKIHTWTQTFVHAGWIPPIWEIEHAQFVLKPIFYSDNVKIQKSHFENVEALLKTKLKNPKIFLSRSSKHSSELVE
jgi:hypothetical protein